MAANPTLPALDGGANSPGTNRYLLPAISIAGGVVAGLALAVLLRAFFLTVTNWSIQAVHWTVSLLAYYFPSWNSVLEDVHTMSDLPRGFDLGLGGFGGVALLTKGHDIAKALSDVVTRWRSADNEKLITAFLTLTFGFAALGLAVYGVQSLVTQDATPTAGPTFVFDTLDIPAHEVRADTGHFAFYIPFGREGGSASFSLDHASVTLTQSDRRFLGQLGQALNACGREDRPVEVQLEGFASSSLWMTAEAEIKSIVASENLSPSNSCDLAVSGRAAAATSLICIADYKQHQRSDPQAQERIADDIIETAKAFNVYLANRRRAAVESALGLTGSNSRRVVLEGSSWRDHREMEDALSIDDSQPGGSVAVKGILTRSVAMTIINGSTCTRTSVDRVERTSLTLR
jgi:hypothetical protein